MTLVCLLLASASAFAQTKTVTGTVTDAANEPLIGASVLVQGTSTGTITDMDGKYSISVTPEDVLAFSYVGMTSQTIKVGTQNVINVTLKEDSQVLAETVVIGYGSAKKRDLTGSIRISMDSMSSGFRKLMLSLNNPSTMYSGLYPLMEFVPRIRIS